VNKITRILAAGTAVLGMAILLTACPPPETTNGGSTPAEPATPGIDFNKISVGLPSRTLDFIGENATALAGAREGRKVFFGNAEEGTTPIYCRELDTGKRQRIAEVKLMVPGSLVASADGHYLAYSRQRRRDLYIDDPNVTAPDYVALVHRFNVATGEEETLFDFRPADWRRYRSDQYMPFISADGSTVYALGYDLDQLTLKQHLTEWLAMEADYRDNLGTAPEPLSKSDERELRMLMLAAHVRPLLRELGVVPLEEGEITIEERDAMETLYRQLGSPAAALMIWREGEAQLLPLQIPERYAQSPFFILTAGNRQLILYVAELGQDLAAPTQLFTVDLETGAVSEFTSFTGVSSSYWLDPAEEHLCLLYNPTIIEERRVLTETHLRRVPLAGGEPSEITLPGDFLGQVDATADGSVVVGQDQDDLDLYAADTATGEKKLLCRALSEINGIFAAGPGDSCVYMENGVLYQIEIPTDPPASADWVDESYFESYREPILSFFTAAGYEVPADVELEMEEHQGMGAHEIAAELRNPAYPGQAALTRYQIEQQRVVSLWFPLGSTFDIDPELAGTDLDYYDARALAEELLDRVGWLSPETRQEYTPGPNPLYDARTDSFIVIFRDGYWLDEEAMDQWVYNADCTVRVHAADGSIAEMTVSELEPVYDQPFDISLDNAIFNIRNIPTQPLPEDAPVIYDTENYRLAVGQKRVEKEGPVKYETVLEPRLCYEIDVFTEEEGDLIWTFIVDTETGEVLGQLNYLPSRMLPMINM